MFFQFIRQNTGWVTYQAEAEADLLYKDGYFANW